MTLKWLIHTAWCGDIHWALQSTPLHHCNQTHLHGGRALHNTAIVREQHSSGSWRQGADICLCLLHAYHIRIGLHRNFQLCIIHSVGLLHRGYSLQSRLPHHVLGLICFPPAIIKWCFLCSQNLFKTHQRARPWLWFHSNYLLDSSGDVRAGTLISCGPTEDLLSPETATADAWEINC